MVVDRLGDRGDRVTGGFSEGGVAGHQHPAVIVEDLEHHRGGPGGQGDLGGIDLIAVPGPGIAEPAIGGPGPFAGVCLQQPLAGQDPVDRGPCRDRPAPRGPVLLGGQGPCHDNRVSRGWTKIGSSLAIQEGPFCDGEHISPGRLVVG